MRVTTRGGAAELRADGRLEISLRPEALRDRTTLARHLEALGRALYAARTRAYREQVRAAGGTTEPPALGRREAMYVARRDAIVASGRSRDGGVRVRVEGMRRWRVEVDRPYRSVAEAETAAREAGEALVRDQLAQVRAVKRTIWQPGGTRAEPGGELPRPEAPADPGTGQDLGRSFQW